MQHTDLFIEEDPPETENLTKTEDPPEMEEPPEMSFGKQLANARKSAGMTQVDLAEKVGYSRAHIALIEQERESPGKSLYNKFVELFGEFSDPSAEPRSENILAVEIESGHWISEDTAIDTFKEITGK